MNSSTKFPMIYHVECKTSPRNKQVEIVNVDPATFHAFVRTTLKEKVGLTPSERRGQFQKYFSTLLLYCDLIVKDWSLDAVENTSIKKERPRGGKKRRERFEKSSNLKIVTRQGHDIVLMPGEE